MPLSLLAARTFASKLTRNNALAQAIASLASGSGPTVPIISSEQVLLSSIPPDLGDKNLLMTYPRICIYSSGIRNTQLEKFRAFSGEIGLTAEIWASADLATNVDQWIHFYVEAVGTLAQKAVGDWGDGLFFAGVYDVQFHAPKPGGLGFVELAKLTLNLNVSRG